MGLFNGEHRQGEFSWKRLIARVLTWPKEMVVLDPKIRMTSEEWVNANPWIKQRRVIWWVPDSRFGMSWWEILFLLFLLFILIAPVEWIVWLFTLGG